MFDFEKAPSSLKDAKFIRNRIKRITALLKRVIATNEVSNDHIHRLVQAVAQMQMTETSCQEAVNSTVLLLCSSISSSWELNLSKMREQFQKYFPHVQAIHDFYNEAKCNDGQELQFEVPITFIELLWKAGW